jgi:hypothetical protein
MDYLIFIIICVLAILMSNELLRAFSKDTLLEYYYYMDKICA